MRRLLLVPALCMCACVKVEVQGRPFGADLEFTGNKVFSRDALRKIAIDSDCRDLVTCELMIEGAYMEQGYVTANLQEADGSYTVEEGPRFVYATITIVESGPGAQPEPLVKRSELAMKEGAPARRSEMKAALDAIHAKYVAAGFPHANVYPLTNVDLEGGKLGLEIRVERQGESSP